MSHTKYSLQNNMFICVEKACDLMVTYMLSLNVNSKETVRKVFKGSFQETKLATMMF